MKRLELSLLSVLLFGSHLRAQVPSSVKASKVQEAAFDPSQSSPLSSPSAQLTLEGTRENAIAKARVGIQLGNATIEAKLSGPIGKDAPSASLADLDGLANKSAIDLGFTWSFWNPTSDTVAQADICTDYLIREEGMTRADATTKARGGWCSYQNLP